MTTLLPLAPVADLETRLGLAHGTLAGLDLARAQAALSDVSTLVRAEAGRDWVDALGIPITPPAVVVIVLQAAMRAYNNPNNYTSESIGDYSYQTEQGASSIYLSNDEIRAVQKAVVAEDDAPTAWRGVGSVQTKHPYGWVPLHRYEMQRWGWR